MNQDQPIIVTGMHRSGTSLLARILNDLGVFMGKKLDTNFESLFFQELNKWIFSQLGARWDYPPNMQDLYSNKEIHKLTIEYLDQCISGPKFLQYLGFKNFFLKKTMNKRNFMWGWKDPRNVYTLPVWLKIFPKAKIITIERHGIDVAKSLVRRSRNRAQVSGERYNKNRWLYHLYKKKAGFTDSLRCSELEGAFSLWEEYIKEANKNFKQHNEQSILKLRYEDLLLEPENTYGEIIEFAGIKKNKIKIDTLTDYIDTKRVYAYKNDLSLKNFAESVSDRLQGYKKS